MKLTDSIHLLTHNFDIPINQDISIPRFVNSLVIFGEKILLIDTGIKNSFQKIFEYIQKNNRKTEEIDRIILSHAHPDHIGSAAEIKRQTGCRILARISEKTWIENITRQAEERPVPGFFTLTDEPVIVDQTLTDRQHIRVGENTSLEC